MSNQAYFKVNESEIKMKGKQPVSDSDAPSMLYHYTDLATLALILKNKTLRLMPLANMDDKQEGKTRDVQNLGRICFASCWTDDQKESIPMWSMYASLDAGVRIGLPPNPFVWELISVPFLCESVGFPKRIHLIGASLRKALYAGKTSHEGSSARLWGWTPYCTRLSIQTTRRDCFRRCRRATTC